MLGYACGQRFLRATLDQQHLARESMAAPSSLGALILRQVRVPMPAAPPNARTVASEVEVDRAQRELVKDPLLARHIPLPSFMSTKRSRAITIAAAGTLTLATAISAAATLSSSSSPASASAGASMTSISRQADAQTVQFTQQAQPAQETAVTAASGSAKQIAEGMLGQFGWSSSQFSCLQSLWEHESGWNVTAENPTSGAYGIPQALPGSQMSSAGSDWQSNAATQIRWGLTYIQSRYGSPCGAWAHEESANWY
jgi:hypothetical protein